MEVVEIFKVRAILEQVPVPESTFLKEPKRFTIGLSQILVLVKDFHMRAIGKISDQHIIDVVSSL